MLRVLVTVLLPLAAPFILYLAWLWLVRRRAAGGELTVDWRTAPWPWLLAVGLAGALYVRAKWNGAVLWDAAPGAAT